MTTDIPLRSAPSYALGMNKSDINPEQAKQLADAVCRQKAFLYRLRERMEKRGFQASDPLYQKVAAAYDAVFRLWVELHYMSCGVKNPGEPVEKPP
jgi:hypothetical protein